MLRLGHPPSSSSSGLCVDGLRSSVEGLVVTAAPIMKRPSTVTRRRRDVVSNYMQTHVDPLMHDLITRLLLEQPADARQALISYLGEPMAKNKGTTQKVSRRDRLYMVTVISPLLTDLLTDLVRARPASPVEYMITWLKETNPPALHPAPTKDPPTSQKKDPPRATGKKEDLPLATNPPDAKEKENVTVARSKLLEAQQLDTMTQKERERCILVVGPARAGKSTIIKALSGDLDPHCRPTSGFRKHLLKYEDRTLAFFDLEGKEKAYRSWLTYAHQVHAVLFVLDSSTDLDIAKKAFDVLSTNDMLRGKPLLVLANKQDAEGACTADDVASALKLSAYQQSFPKKQPKVAVCPCVGNPQFSASKTVDEQLERAIEWLVHCVNDDADSLANRIHADTTAVEAADKEKAQAKERRVFRKTIRKAFPQEGTPEECFTKEEGLDYFASELGIPLDSLPEAAKHIASLVNYQKLALSIIGNFHCPINKKKRQPMDWDQIEGYVLDRKKEAWDEHILQQDDQDDIGGLKARQLAKLAKEQQQQQKA